MNVDIIGLLQKQKELTEAANEEVRLLKEKHKDALAGYSAEADELDLLVKEFHAKWDSQIAEYKKEGAALKKKYKMLAALAREEFTIREVE